MTGPILFYFFYFFSESSAHLTALAPLAQTGSARKRLFVDVFEATVPNSLNVD